MSVTEGTNTTTFIYNGLGDRVQETANGVTTTFAPDNTKPMSLLPWVTPLARRGEQDLDALSAQFV